MFVGSADGYLHSYQLPTADDSVVPTVTQISPPSGPTSGGTTVDVTGTNFNPRTTVMFGATPAAVVTVMSSTQLAAVAPAGTIGTVDVTVTTPYGTSETFPSDQYTYVHTYMPPAVYSVSPNTGGMAGGTSVIIEGKNFKDATVKFGTVPAKVLTDEGTKLRVLAPAEFPGLVDVTVTTPNGTSVITPSDEYIYTG